MATRREFFRTLGLGIAGLAAAPFVGKALASEAAPAAVHGYPVNVWEQERLRQAMYAVWSGNLSAPDGVYMAKKKKPKKRGY